MIHTADNEASVEKSDIQMSPHQNLPSQAQKDLSISGKFWQSNFAQELEIENEADRQNKDDHF